MNLQNTKSESTKQTTGGSQKGMNSMLSVHGVVSRRVVLRVPIISSESKTRNFIFFSYITFTSKSAMQSTLSPSNYVI